MIKNHAIYLFKIVAVVHASPSVIENSPYAYDLELPTQFNGTSVQNIFEDLKNDIILADYIMSRRLKMDFDSLTSSENESTYLLSRKPRGLKLVGSAVRKVGNWMMKKGVKKGVKKGTGKFLRKVGDKAVKVGVKTSKVGAKISKKAVKYSKKAWQGTKGAFGLKSCDSNLCKESLTKAIANAKKAGKPLGNWEILKRFRERYMKSGVATLRTHWKKLRKVCTKTALVCEAKKVTEWMVIIGRIQFLGQIYLCSENFAILSLC